MAKFLITLERECVELVEVEIEAIDRAEAITMAEELDHSELDWHMSDYLGDAEVVIVEEVKE
jgi:hypothetical protein